MIGAASMAVVGVPLGMALADPPASHTLADCPGSINVPIMNIGTPVDTCPGPTAPAYTGGAPSQQVLTDCSGIPGCLSNVLYGPGNVYVPKPNTTVQQSQ
jgi:hypothetical protein